MKNAIIAINRRCNELDVRLDALLARCTSPANSSYKGSPAERYTPYVGHPEYVEYAKLKAELAELTLASSLLAGMTDGLHKLWEDTYSAGAASIRSGRGDDPPPAARINPFEDA